MENGTIITNPDIIKSYVGRYYENLYKKENCNLQKQNQFLANIQRNITDLDNSFFSKRNFRTRIIFNSLQNESD